MPTITNSRTNRTLGIGRFERSTARFEGSGDLNRLRLLVLPSVSLSRPHSQDGESDRPNRPMTVAVLVQTPYLDLVVSQMVDRTSTRRPSIFRLTMQLEVVDQAGPVTLDRLSVRFPPAAGARTCDVDRLLASVVFAKTASPLSGPTSPP
jgi:hypothetical protein